MAGSLFYFSCGDPSERPGREAGEEHNITTKLNCYVEVGLAICH